MRKLTPKKLPGRQRTGFCIQGAEQGFVGVSVTTAGERWRVEDISRTTPDGQLGAKLRSAMAKAATPVTWLLADGEAGISHLKMPKLRTKALKRAFVGGLARDEGGKPEDWCITWKALSSAGKSGGQATEAHILHHATKEIVSGKQAVAGSWGVELKRMLPAHLALDLFYRAHGPDRSDHEVWNLVFVGGKQQFLCVATRDAQLVIRNLPANLSTGNDLQEYLGQLATEIDRSAFFARQTENSPEVEKIIVCGDPRIAAPLVEVLAETSPTPAVHWSIQEMFEWGLNEHHADDLLTLAGAVLALENIPYNLLADGGSLRLGRKLRRQILVGVGTCAAAVVPLLMVGGVVTANIQTSYLERATTRLEVAQVKAQQAERAYDAQRLLLAREDQMRHFVGMRPDFETILLQLAALTPVEVVLKNLQVREQADGRFSLGLQGESRAVTGARAQGAFLGFLAALDDCDFLVRLGEPRLMKIIPAENKSGAAADFATGKTTVFHLDLEWRQTNKGDG